MSSNVKQKTQRPLTRASGFCIDPILAGEISSSIIRPQGHLHSLVEDAEEFLRKDWYISAGIPHRRDYPAWRKK
ncbi:hypothetical protein C8R44DRAFT_618246 [Mycena epipterygia]|nr:hypothetical protein C8R44DRAFT_618246 [Mycena epipterygia]